MGASVGPEPTFDKGDSFWKKNMSIRKTENKIRKLISVKKQK